MKLLIKKEAKIIILSHIGRPQGKVVKGMTLEPISKKLSSLLNKKILFNNNTINEQTLFEVNKIENGSIMMLENIRFNEGEEVNDTEFSKKYLNWEIYTLTMLFLFLIDLKLLWKVLQNICLLILVCKLPMKLML